MKKQLPFILALGLLTAAAIAMPVVIDRYKLFITKLAIYPEDRRLLNSIHLRTENWECTSGDRRETEEVEKTLGTKNYITRVYTPVKGGKPALQLHAAYYTGMIDTVPHVPDRCFVAGGMELGTLTNDVLIPFDNGKMIPDRDVPQHLQGRIYKVRSSDHRHVRLPRDPQQIRLHTMKFVDRGRDLYAGYFFIANGGCVARAEDVRLLAFDLRSTYAYYLKVQVTSSDVGSQEELAQAAASLLTELFGDLMLCTPDWVEVETGRYPPPEAAPGTND
jgi:hypothetical protein